MSAWIGGRRAFVQGDTDYTVEKTDFANLWVIDLDDEGRASAFTEWWMDKNGGDPD